MTITTNYMVITERGIWEAVEMPLIFYTLICTCVATYVFLLCKIHSPYTFMILYTVLYFNKICIARRALRFRCIITLIHQYLS